MEQDKSDERISYIINQNTKTGVFGFIYYHDLNRTPYSVYRLVINSLCDELSIDNFSESFIKNMYETNDLYTLYIMDEIAASFESFYVKLIDKDPIDLISELENDEDDEDIQDIQENNIVLYYVDITQNDAFENLNDEKTKSNNYKYIKSNENNVNYKEKLLDGIIYFTINEDNSITVYYLEY